MADDQRIRPNVQGRTRLLQALAAVAPAHVIDPGALGEYAQLVAEHGRPYADRQLTEVAAHLAAGCSDCAADLQEMIEMAGDDESAPPDQAGFAAVPPRPQNDPGVSAPPRLTDDSGIHARDLPDPRLAEAEAERQRQLRTWRERLLIVAAVAVLLIGLSLIGMAYLASGPQQAPRLDLAPQPAATAGQTAPTSQPAPAVPPVQPASPGFAAPSGMSCPSTHPIKGNRSSGIYHVPGGSLYDATRPEQCFAQPSDAEAAGYRRSQR